jgi:ribosomal protein L7Ae-like RNA K-turn-binding protein
VKVANDLPELTDRLLARAALDALAMATKAGLVAAGFGKTETALERNEVVGVIRALDAGPDGVSKLKSALRRRPDADQIAVIAGFSTAQLDLALGRSNVVHAALLAGPVSDAFLARYTRLERFRAGETDVAGHHRAASRA